MVTSPSIWDLFFAPNVQTSLLFVWFFGFRRGWILSYMQEFLVMERVAFCLPWDESSPIEVRMWQPDTYVSRWRWLVGRSCFGLPHWAETAICSKSMVSTHIKAFVHDVLSLPWVTILADGDDDMSRCRHIHIYIRTHTHAHTYEQRDT